MRDLETTPRIDQRQGASRPALEAGHVEHQCIALLRSFLAAPERVLAAFQETMRTFLEVQRTTMLAYLSGQAAAVRRASQRSHAGTPEPPERWAPPDTALPRFPLSLPLLLRSRPSRGAAAVDSRPSPASPPAKAGREAIARKLLEIVRDRTGYPLEVLRLELDLEADLGIDSIKRVEILGKLRDAFPQIGNASDPQAMDGCSPRRPSGPSSIASSGRSEVRVRRQLAPAASRKPDPGMETRNGKVHHGTAPAAPGDGGCPSRGPGEPGLMPGGTVLVTDDGRGSRIGWPR